MATVGQEMGQSISDVLRGVDEAGFDEMVLNMGPQHPSTHGVLRLLLRTEGEVIRECKFVIGYLHRCHEKIAEKHGYVGSLPLCSRLDYVAAMQNEWAMCLGVERLADLEIPERAEHLRVIASELNRIASHLLFIATYGTDVGAVTVFLHGFREREMFLDLMEIMSGQRLTYHYYRIGGVGYDVPPDFGEKVLATLDHLERRLPEYDDLFTNNRIFRARTEGVGSISAEHAMGMGMCGPNLRASGVPYDVRRADPYGIYDRFDFEIPVRTQGDCFDRYWVRRREIEESMKILRQAVDQMPADGEILNRKRGALRTKEGWAYGHTEGARGEVGYFFVSTGGSLPYRMKIRSPCFCNLQGLEPIMAGWKIADVIMILGSVDIVLGCVDR